MTEINKDLLEKLKEKGFSDENNSIIDSHVRYVKLLNDKYIALSTNTDLSRLLTERESAAISDKFNIAHRDFVGFLNAISDGRIPASDISEILEEIHVRAFEVQKWLNTYIDRVKKILKIDVSLLREELRLLLIEENRLTQFSGGARMFHKTTRKSSLKRKTTKKASLKRKTSRKSSLKRKTSKKASLKRKVKK
jgi:hypothetical protein